ncbi:MAG: ABC transporter permease [Bacteroidales bacterium]|nr:ABC transporter permease [Bacteroidales bacterium]
MNWNAFVTSYRFILKSKLFTAINLIGLTAGLTVSFFLMIFIINELSYNSFHDQRAQIFRILTHTGEGITMPYSPTLLPHKLKEYSPDLLRSGRIVSLLFITGPVAVKQGHEYRDEPGFFCADPSIFDILTFRMVSGQGKAGLETPGGVLLSQPAAERYFGQTDPIGKPIELTTGGIPVTLKVAGVFSKLPWNSTIDVEFLAGMDLFTYLFQQNGIDIAAEAEQFADYYVENYILVKENKSIAELTDLLPPLLDSLGMAKEQVSFTFQNIRDIHLDSEEIINDFHQKGSRSALFYYVSLAFAILLLAGINYSILNTARSALRFKEIGVRKVLGATKRELRTQLLTESILLTSLALPLSFLVLGFAEPFVDSLYGYDIQLYTWNMLIYIPLFAAITLLIGGISGGYLAFYLAALNPLKALKNQVFTRQRFSLSKLFIVFQLVITLFLITCMMIIFAQLDYCMNPTSGIRKENLLIVSFNPGEFTGYSELRDRIRDGKGVVSVSGSSIIPPTNDRSSISYTVTENDSVNVTYSLENYFIDRDFFTTLGIEFVAGEDAKPDDENPSRTPIIINQAAEEMINLQEPLGATLGRSIITGIVRDFNIHSFYSRIAPAVFTLDPSACIYLVIRCRPGTMDLVRQQVESEWKEMAPELPFSCSTFNDELNLMYSREEKFGQVVASFSFLAFLITGMGLFGLALLMIERRLKEIAVRKIFGASNKDILFRMQKEFLIYTLLASILSIPATIYIMNIWLSAFYYKVPLHWYLFVIALLFIIVFVSSIIMIRTWTILRKNLINVLRYE